MALVALIWMKPDPLQGVMVRRNSWRQRMLVISAMTKAAGSNYGIETGMATILRLITIDPEISAMIRIIVCSLDISGR